MKPRVWILFAVVFVMILVSGPTWSIPVTVTATGTVDFNQITDPPLGNVGPGESVTMSFIVDSDNFQDSVTFPVRGYVIDEASFVMRFDSAQIGLQDPFPFAQEPFLVLRDNDPAVDGFFLATNPDGLPRMPLDQTGIFEQFSAAYSITYGGTTLSSLDILDALGTYDFTGLESFQWDVEDGPFAPLSIIFQEMTISADVVNAPPGRVPTNMVLESVGGGDLLIRWSKTICETDADYGIYEGQLGTWDSHTPVVCTDALGDRTEVFTAGPGSHYYLVVPSSAGEEGSYGTDSTQNERARGLSVCEIQQSLECLASP